MTNQDGLDFVNVIGGQLTPEGMADPLNPVPTLPAFTLIGNSNSPSHLIHYAQSKGLTVPGLIIPAIVDVQIDGCRQIREKLLDNLWTVIPQADQIWSQMKIKSLWVSDGVKDTVIFLVNNETLNLYGDWIHKAVIDRLNADHHQVGDTAIVMSGLPKENWMHGLKADGKHVTFPNLLAVVVSRYPRFD